MTSPDLAKALPTAPDGLGWEIRTNGDGKDPEVTIRLENLTSNNAWVAGWDYELPKTCTPENIVALVKTEADKVLTAHRRSQVLRSLPGIYDGLEALDFEPEAEQEQAA